jgi:hypothetical protein
MNPSNGTIRGGTTVTLTGTNLGATWSSTDATAPPVSVKFNNYTCQVTSLPQLASHA